MTELYRKSKMITIRLSAGEYELLKRLYPSYGARNVSDFARSAMQRVIAGESGPTTLLAAKIQALDSRLNAVEARIAQFLGQEISS